MKSYSKYFIVYLLWMLSSCSRDNIKLYSDVDYIQFTKYIVDSLSCTFIGTPEAPYIMFPLEIEVIGIPMDRDREYKISVVEEYTNATERNYDLPTSTVVRAGRVIDTCWIKAIRTEEIATTPVRLSLRLEESNDFKVGQSDKIGVIMYITNLISKPNWWTTTVTNSYLGEYSDKKYRLFIQETGMVDLDPDDKNEMRYYSIIFKNYLLKEKDEGRTVYEDDGQEMTLTLIPG